MFSWESATTSPNSGDDVYIEIFVVDDSEDPCQVEVDVLVDVGYDYDYVVAPYIQLGDSRQVIYNGPLGVDDMDLPYTTVLWLDKPTSPTGWVLGYMDYNDIAYLDEPGMGPEQSPRLTDPEP